MTTTPQIVTTVDQPYAALHVTVARDQIQKVMGPSIQQVYAAVAAQGLSPTGAWFTHHLRRPAATFDFEVCVPVGTRFESTGEIEGKTWPAMTVAQTELRGNYDKLGAAWGEFVAWTEQQGLSMAPDLWEVYRIGPESSNNPDDWRTELNWQVLK
jgi:effector-binding domain-containing protein